MRQSSSSNALNAQDEKDVVDTLVVPPRGRCLTANGEAVANRGYDNARVRELNAFVSLCWRRFRRRISRIPWTFFFPYI
jgi:hypothetical protein